MLNSTNKIESCDKCFTKVHFLPDGICVCDLCPNKYEDGSGEKKKELSELAKNILKLRNKRNF